jgi:hypothetical protein
MSECVALTAINLDRNKLTAAGLKPFCSSPPSNLTMLQMANCGLKGTYIGTTNQGNQYDHVCRGRHSRMLHTDYPYSIGLLKARGCDISTDGNPGGGTLVGSMEAVKDAWKLDYSGLGLRGVCSSNQFLRLTHISALPGSIGGLYVYSTHLYVDVDALVNVKNVNGFWEEVDVLFPGKVERDGSGRVVKLDLSNMGLTGASFFCHTSAMTNTLFCTFRAAPVNRGPLVVGGTERQ